MSIRNVRVDYAAIEAAVAAGLRARRRRRRAAVAVGGAGAAAVALVAGLLVSGGSDGQAVHDPKRPPVPVTDASGRRLMEVCATSLKSKKATEGTFAVNPAQTFAIALVRDDNEAIRCTSEDGDLYRLKVSYIPLTDGSAETVVPDAWRETGSSDGLTYAAAVIATGGGGPWVGGSDFTIGPKKQVLRHEGTLNLALVQRPRPLTADQYIVVGLLDAPGGCMCGSTIQIYGEEADPSGDSRTFVPPDTGG